MQEHPIWQESHQFIDEVNTYFSKKDARLLLDAIATSYDVARESLPIQSDVEHFDFRLLNGLRNNLGNLTVCGSASPSGRSEMIFRINSQAEVSGLLDTISNVMIHEVAHLNHRELNPDFFKALTDRGENFLWVGALIEGVALRVGHEVGVDFPDHVAQESPQLINAVADALHKKSSRKRTAYQGFLQGGETFRHRGYKVGEYVVSHLFDSNLICIEQLMGISVEEFSEYALQKII